MRALPLQVILRRTEAWRRGVGCVAGVAIVSLLAWWWALPRPWTLAAPLLALLGIAATAWLATRLVAVPRYVIRWDGRSWFVHLPSAEPRAGTVSVALDVDRWMLLRYVPDIGGVGARPIWLPLQRRGLEASWHALRCAAYAPRPHLQPAAPP